MHKVLRVSETYECMSIAKYPMVCTIFVCKIILLFIYLEGNEYIEMHRDHGSSFVIVVIGQHSTNIPLLMLQGRYKNMLYLLRWTLKCNKETKTWQKRRAKESPSSTLVFYCIVNTFYYSLHAYVLIRILSCIPFA